MAKKRRAGWMSEHVSDPFVKRAQVEGYRSRAVYKLLEIDDKHRLFRPGMTVVDLGAAPGGWSQIAADRVGGAGRVIALDRLEMEPITGVTFLQEDFEEASGLDALLAALPDAGADLVLSDMAPNLSEFGTRIRLACPRSVNWPSTWSIVFSPPAAPHGRQVVPRRGFRCLRGAISTAVRAGEYPQARGLAAPIARGICRGGGPPRLIASPQAAVGQGLCL